MLRFGTENLVGLRVGVNIILAFHKFLWLSVESELKIAVDALIPQVSSFEELL